MPTSNIGEGEDIPAAGPDDDGSTGPGIRLDTRPPRQPNPIGHEGEQDPQHGCAAATS